MSKSKGSFARDVFIIPKLYREIRSTNDYSTATIFAVEQFDLLRRHESELRVFEVELLI